GRPKSSRFVTEAAHKGLLTLTKLENGQSEVGSAKQNGEAPIAAEKTLAAAPAEKEGERPRRGRRGGRGRGREASTTAKAVVAETPVAEIESTERESTE